MSTFQFLCTFRNGNLGVVMIRARDRRRGLARVLSRSYILNCHG